MEKKREEAACNKALVETVTNVCGLSGMEFRSKCLLEQHVEQHEKETDISNPFDKTSSLRTNNLQETCNKDKLILKVEPDEDINSSDTLSAEDSSATLSADENSDTFSADESEFKMGLPAKLDSETYNLKVNVVPSIDVSYHSPRKLTTTQYTCNRPTILNACKQPIVLPSVSPMTLRTNHGLVTYNSDQINDISKLRVSASQCLGRARLKVHMLTHRQGTVECNVCDKKFNSKDAIKLHSRIHTGEAAVTCPMSNKSITQSSNLKMHLQTHITTNERRFKCKVCGKSFQMKYQMKEHVKCHENARAYLCHVCGKSFNTLSYIISHIHTHNGGRKKAYRCEICNKSFTGPSTVRQHKMKSHNIGVRPYLCELCGKGFASQRDLKRHHLTHTGEKPYKCEYCPQRFSQQAPRNTHRLIHTGAKPRVCEICDMKFRYLSSLNNHMRRHARDGEISESKDESEHNPQT